MSALTLFLRHAAAAEFEYGEWDCLMTPANWVRQVTGDDPAAEFRGRYHTRLGWVRIILREARAAGREATIGSGILAVFERLALGAGLRPTAHPAPGDVGVVSATGLGAIGGIFTGRGWAVKVNRSLVRARTETMKAWTFTHPLSGLPAINGLLR